MMSILFLFPIADFKTVTVPTQSTTGERGLPALDLATLLSETGIYVVAVVLLLAFTYLILSLGTRAKQRPPADVGPQNWILVDGSNVMHWEQNTPKLAPLLRVIERLRTLGYVPGIVFDANAGWKLFGRYMDDDDLAHLLQLQRDQVFVVPKGTQADPFLLSVARDLKARIVTNDRYRDWAETYPEVQERGFLVQGEMRGAKVWLRGMEAAEMTRN